MEEVLALLKQMDERMKNIENQLVELKHTQKPLTNKDFIRDLNKCPGIEFGFWATKIEVTKQHLKTLLSELNNMKIIVLEFSLIKIIAYSYLKTAFGN
jgi:hypothetical protein